MKLNVERRLESREADMFLDDAADECGAGSE
jgi:hypothetical protein